MNLEGKLLENVLVAEIGFLKASHGVRMKEWEWKAGCRSHLSVVNLLSLLAFMKAGERRKARRLRLPCELRLTS